VLVDREVPGEAGGVPVAVTGDDDVAVDAGAEAGKAERLAGRSQEA